MGRLRPDSVAAQTKRSTSHGPARRDAAGTPLTKRSVAGRTVVLGTGKEQRTYKLLHGVNTFLYVIIERHKIFERRYAGEPGPWTDDEILRNNRFTNVYRILDRDTQYIIHVVIRNGPSQFKECVFRVLLFRLFDRIETYEFLCEEFGTPTWKDFDREAYKTVLDRRRAAKHSLAGGAYQMPAPTAKAIGGSSYHDRLLRLLELMMLSKIDEDLSECTELADVQALIARYPTMKGFMGYQVVLDLNMIPKLMLPEDWALPGPGAELGLSMIFGEPLLKSKNLSLALSWLHEHFEELALGAGFSKKDIPALRPSSPGLSIVDIEHMLCEFSKYARLKSSSYGSRSFDLEVARAKVTRHLPVNWKPASVAFLERNRMYTNPPANKKGEYVPLAILDKEYIDKELHYKVRWEGWGPDADTWEPAATFNNDVVDRFEERLNKIAGLVKQYISNEI